MTQPASLAAMAMHAGHEIEIMCYPGDPVVYLECATCRCVLFEFGKEDFPHIYDNAPGADAILH